jgi:UDP-N-acetyl-D-mannosaminuronic acid dehydrogenase
MRSGEISNSSKVLVVGLGQLGLPVAAYVKQRGFDVYGYDISPVAIKRAEEKFGIKEAQSMAGFDTYIVCVSTHQPENMLEPQIEGLLSAVNKIAKEAPDGALVIIESTIPVSTSAQICASHDHRFHVAHAPHRWYALDEKEHGVNQPRVVGGVHECCLDAAMEFYGGKSADRNSKSRIKKNLGIPMHSLSQVELAELTKIIENAHRYVQIAFAEDLYLYCAINHLSFAELRSALNTKWNVNILEPRQGIGGHCLPKDTKMFLNSSRHIRSKIISAAMEVDADYRNHIKAGQPNLTINQGNVARASVPG